MASEGEDGCCLSCPNARAASAALKHVGNSSFILAAGEPASRSAPPAAISEDFSVFHEPASFVHCPDAREISGRVSLLFFPLCLLMSLLGILSSWCPKWVLTLGVILAGVDSSVGRDGGGQGAHTLRLSSVEAWILKVCS